MNMLIFKLTYPYCSFTRYYYIKLIHQYYIQIINCKK